MTTNIQTFFGPPAVTSIVGADVAITTGASQLPYAPSAVGGVNFANLKELQCGAISANTYKTLLSVSGAGWVNFAAIAQRPSGTQNMAIRVFVDGVQVFERATALSADYNGKMLIAIGGTFPDLATSANWAGGDFQPVRFNSSIVIDVRSSTATTNINSLLVNYTLTA